MKNCPNCNQQLDDNATFCTNCGTQLGGEQPNNQQQFNNGQQFNSQQPYGAQPQYAAPVDQYDHTSEFDPKDISDNKVYAMLVYLTGAIGIIIALLAAKNSKYVEFHLRQGIKFFVVDILVTMITVLLCWTIIVPIAAAILIVVLTVLQLICFFQVCSGKAKEPAIIRSLNFLK